MSGTQSLPSKAFPPKYLRAVRDMIGSIPPPVTPRKIRKYLKDNPEAKKIVKDAYNPKYYAKAMLAYNKMLASTGDEKAQKRVDDHMEVTKEFERDFLGTTLDRNTPAGKVMYDNVMNLISEKFPLKAIMRGKEYKRGKYYKRGTDRKRGKHYKRGKITRELGRLNNRCWAR